jgi:urease accessory protein
MAHPGPSGRASVLTVEVDVADGAELRWTPQPTILVQGCDHHVTTRVRLGAGAALVWREELVLGRHGEPSGSILQRLVVDDPDGPLLRTDLALGPRWPGSLGPAGVGGARSVGTVLLVGAAPTSAPPVPGVRWAATALGRDGAHLVTAVGDEVAPMAAVLDRVVPPAGAARVAAP